MLTPLRLPQWLTPHLYAHRNFEELHEQEITTLTQRLRGFQHATPDVSVVIPAWNEGATIHKALSSLAANATTLKVEIIVINNNSTDKLQQVLDRLGVRSFFEPRQGIAYARQLGLKQAKGTYHLCADADSMYPPNWIEQMIQPMRASGQIAAVYGRYAFVPPHGKNRRHLWLYEQLTGLLVLLRRKRQEFVNVLGLNMGFVAELGRVAGGFETSQARVFDNALNLEESEDGLLAKRLQSKGRLQLLTGPHTVVFTSPRKILRDGSILHALKFRVRLHLSRLAQYW